MTRKQAEHIVRDVNKILQRDCAYPAAFIREGEDVPTISAESCCGRHSLAADFYSGQIEPRLAAYAINHNLLLEWENPGALQVYED